MRNLLPLFLDLAGRSVLLVGGGPVALAKLRQLVAAGARVRVVSPVVLDEVERLGRSGAASATDVQIVRRGFQPSDLDDVWLVVAAATPAVNREVAQAASERRVFVNAVDDPSNASAYLSGVVRRDEVTIAVSTSGDAPALTSLVREALDAVLPRELAEWVTVARSERLEWRRDGVPMEERKPLLLRALNDLYADDEAADRRPAGVIAFDRGTVASRIPWLSGPEDSWL
jgi:uroporphyrin-III C-methyltransferase/precorrin-2 dehydrogenase/sirohydrochlorin ferrochelatase